VKNIEASERNLFKVHPNICFVAQQFIQLVSVIFPNGRIIIAVKQVPVCVEASKVGQIGYGAVGVDMGNLEAKLPVTNVEFAGVVLP